MSVADAMAENGMKDLGYEYINLDGEMKHTSPGTHLGTAIGPPLHLGLQCVSMYAVASFPGHPG